MLNLCRSSSCFSLTYCACSSYFLLLFQDSSNFLWTYFYLLLKTDCLRDSYLYWKFISSYFIFWRIFSFFFWFYSKNFYFTFWFYYNLQFFTCSFSSWFFWSSDLSNYLLALTSSMNLRLSSSVSSILTLDLDRCVFLLILRWVYYSSICLSCWITLCFRFSSCSILWVEFSSWWIWPKSSYLCCELIIILPNFIYFLTFLILSLINWALFSSFSSSFFILLESKYSAISPYNSTLIVSFSIDTLIPDCDKYERFVYCLWEF